MNLYEFQLSKLARATDDIAGYLAAAELKLYKTEIAINEATTQAELEAAECDFTGYSAAVLTWGAPSIADDDTVESISSSPIFRPTDAVTPNDAWGLWLGQTITGEPLFAAEFDGAPLPMADATDVIQITLRFRPATDTLAVVVS